MTRGIKREKHLSDSISSAEGPAPRLVSGLPPELTADEALTPGVLKLILRELEKSDQRVTELQQSYETALDEKTEAEKENIVLKTKLSYSTIWDVLIALTGISGGSVVAVWEGSRDVAILLAIITVLLFALASWGRKT